MYRNFVKASVTRLSSPPPAVTPIVAPMLIPVMNSLVSQNEVQVTVEAARIFLYM